MTDNMAEVKIFKKGLPESCREVDKAWSEKEKTSEGKLRHIRVQGPKAGPS